MSQVFCHRRKRQSGRAQGRLGLAGLCLALLCAAVTLTGSEASATKTTSANAATSALALANHHYAEGHFKKAAALYHEAFQLNPNAAYLFNAARAEMRAFAHDSASRNFSRYLGLSKATPKGKARARAHIQEIEAYQTRLVEQRKRGKALAANAAAKARAKATRPLDTLTMGLWIGAGALLIGSGTIFGVATILRGSTNAQKITEPADITAHNNAVKTQDNWRNVSVLALLGAAGVGTWAYIRTKNLRKPEPIAGARLTPWLDGRGLSLQGRF